MNINNLPLVSCIVFFTSDFQKVLVVSRKNSHDQFGLPGGKVDGIESSLDAAVREVQEEVGINLDAAHLFNYNYYSDCVDDFKERYCGKNDLKSLAFENEDNGYWVTTYIAPVFLKETLEDYINVENSLVTLRGWNELKNGPFIIYNTKLYHFYKDDLKLPL